MTKKAKPDINHLVSMETLDIDTINYLMDEADNFLKKTLSKEHILDTLKGKVVAVLFYESSTRSRNSFVIAAKRLSAITINPDMNLSAILKGESLLDTIHTFEAMGVDLFAIRHPDNNAAQFVASELNGPASIVNAGDGDNQHPTQALLDLMTIRQYKSQFNDLTVAIVGDISHSRVARSLIAGLKIMGTTQIHLIAPPDLAPEDAESLGVKVFNNFEEGLSSADVVVALRIQKERMQEAQLPDFEKYHNEFGLTAERLALAKSDAIVMHPGPMNRGVEIDSNVADGPQSVILQQVQNGIAMRMAVMETLLI